MTYVIPRMADVVPSRCRGVAPIALVAAVLLAATAGCGRRAAAVSAATTTPKMRDGGQEAPPPPDAVLRTLTPGDIQREMHKARGHVLFVHLWASWCGPCLEELPLMHQFAGAARARGAVVLSISVDSDRSAIARIPALLRARAPGLTATVAHFDDPEQLTSLFSKSWEGAIPAMFVFDRAGKLKKSLIGEVEGDDLDGLLADILPPPSQAKTPAAKSPSRAR